MCTCPNYMLPIGTHINKDGERKVTYQFIGHHEFKKMTRFFQDNLLSFVEVPCQKCLECRVQYARTWADRCVLEAKQYKYNYFVTLTYDDYFLPDRNSLEPKDVQLFLKRLRKKFKGIKIRVLYSGEYGDVSWRPHYHLLLFNLPLDDLTYQFERKEVVDVDLTTGKPIFGPYLKYNMAGNKKNMMFSKTIYELWMMGNISVQDFNYDTAAYVSQYVTKKANPNNVKLYKELNIYPEFIRTQISLSIFIFLTIIKNRFNRTQLLFISFNTNWIKSTITILFNKQLVKVSWNAREMSFTILRYYQFR